MLRSLLAVFAILLVAVGLSVAAEVKGKVKSVDAKKSTLTVTIDKETRMLPVDKDAVIFTLDGDGMKAKIVPLSGGLASVKPGANVTLLTEMKDETEIITSVKIESNTAPAQPMKKKKK